MTMPIDPETAKRLLDAGQINPATYDSYVGNANVQKPAAPTGPVFGDARGASLADQNLVSAKDFLQEKKREEFVKKRDIARAAGFDEAEMKNADWWSSDFDDEANLELNNPRLTPADFADDAPRVDLAEQERLAQETVPMGGLASDPAMGGSLDPYAGMNTAGYDLYQRSLAEGAVIGARKAEEEASYLREMQQNMAAMEKNNEKMRLEEQGQLEKKQEQLNDEIERVASMKIDSGKMWADMGNGNKVAAGIALALGALGAANNGVNQAARIINAAIDRDIKIQEANISSERQGVTQKRGLLAQMRQTFKDDQMARQAAKIAYLSNAQIGMKEISARYQGQEAAEKAKQMIAMVEVEKDKLRQQFLAEAKAKMPISPNADISSIPADMREYWVPGYGAALTKSDAKMIKEDIIPEVTKITGSLDDLIAIAEDGGSSIPFAEGGRRAAVIATMLKGQLIKPIVGAGAVSEGERALIDRIVKDPSKMLSTRSGNITALKEIKRKILQGRDAVIHTSMGLKKPSDRIGYKPNKG